MNAANQNFQPQSQAESRTDSRLLHEDRRALAHNGASLARTRHAQEIEQTKRAVAANINNPHVGALQGIGQTLPATMGMAQPQDPLKYMGGGDRLASLLQQYQQGRDFYVKQTQAAITGQPSPLLNNGQYGSSSIPISAVSSGIGGMHTGMMGIGHDFSSHAEESVAQAAHSMMRYPTTDPLAYSRSIKYPQSFNHAVYFGN